MHWLTRLTPRTVNALGAATCAGLMGFALYAQYVLNIRRVPGSARDSEQASVGEHQHA